MMIKSFMYEFFIFLTALILSLYGLVKSSDYLILTSSILGRRLKISKIVIGLTIVAIGTSLPELFSVIFGLLNSKSGGDFFSGTIIGSNIANSILILATLLYFSTQKIPKINYRENLFLIISTIFFIFMIYFNWISLSFGIIFLLLFFLYIYINLFKEKNTNLENDFEELSTSYLIKKSSFFIVLLFILSIFVLNISAMGVVYGIDSISNFFLVPEFLLTFTTLALATSLPELFVTYRACKNKQTDIALGNIVGSNISNILLIGGIGSILIGKLNILVKVLEISLIGLIIATLFLLLVSKFLSKKYYKIVGIGLLIFYLILVILILISV